MNDPSAKDHVVVTRARMPRSQRTITHAYGPYTKNKAKSVKSNIKREAIRLGQEIEVSCCRILDPEGMSRDVIPETLREAIRDA